VEKALYCDKETGEEATQAPGGGGVGPPVIPMG